jgi:N utilization substance protein A
MNRQEIQYIALLEDLTGTVAKDCVYDSSCDRLIFVVPARDAGRVIGKGGETIRRLKDSFKKQIDIVEYAESPEEFARNTISPARATRVSFMFHSDSKVAAIYVSPTERRRAIGRDGRVITRSRILLKRHFAIDDVKLIVE